MKNTSIKAIDIVLLKPQMEYLPGQLVQGQMLVHLVSDIKTNGVKIQCFGRAYTSWSEGMGDDRKSYSGNEEYVDTTLLVYGNVTGELVVLPAGNHVFPFEFLLPPAVPGSFEIPGGCFVRYWLEGKVDHYSNKATCPFTVGHILDLNQVDGVLNPSQVTDSKTVCCCCCESGPVQATLRLDKTGYVPGEPIVCSAEINNGTDGMILSSTIKLIMMTHMYTDLKASSTVIHREIAKLQHGRISAGGSDVIAGERLMVPPLPPSHLPGCSIIDIEYLVQLVLDVEGTPFDLKLATDIIIGTIALHSTVRPPRGVPNSLELSAAHDNGQSKTLPYGVITNQPTSNGPWKHNKVTTDEKL